MRNRYAGHCLRCQKLVQPGEGYFQRLTGRGWLVRCIACVGKGNKSDAGRAALGEKGKS